MFANSNSFRNKLVLYRSKKKITDKTNEIPIVQEMLDVIDIKDAVVTMDAMHCQKITGKKWILYTSSKVKSKEIV